MAAITTADELLVRKLRRQIMALPIFSELAQMKYKGSLEVMFHFDINGGHLKNVKVVESLTEEPAYYHVT